VSAVDREAVKSARSSAQYSHGTAAPRSRSIGHALWLGHESVETTQMYMHADLRLKEKALARITAPESKPGRYRPKDSLLAFLEGL